MRTTLNILLIIVIALSTSCNKSDSVEPNYGLISAKVRSINKQFIPPIPYDSNETFFYVFGDGPEECASSIGIRCPISIDSPWTYTLTDHDTSAWYDDPGCPGGGTFGGCGHHNEAIEVSKTFTVITKQRLKGTFNFTTSSFRVINGVFDVGGEQIKENQRLYLPLQI